jgi:hypothetical protein
MLFVAFQHHLAYAQIAPPQTNWKIDMNPSEVMNGNNASFLIQYIVRAR